MSDFSEEERARRANNLLQDELFVEAFDLLKKRFTEPLGKQWLYRS